MPPKYYNETLQIHKITSKQIHNSNIPLLVHISDVLLSVFWWEKKNLFNQKQKFSEAKSLFQLTDSSLSLREVRAETQARTG